MPKEIKKVRGTARIYDDDSLDFTPQKEGNPVQKNVKKVRRSAFYTTNGEKASSYVMHLNADVSDTDPVATLTEDFDKLVKNIDKKATKPLTGKKILDNGATVVYVNKKAHALQISINVDLEKELSAKLRSEQGTWAGAQDLDCKSFSNELGGNDYANAQAVNGLIEVNMNQVITGTQDAMNRKINTRNCLDGLATRLIMYEMPDNSFVMLQKDTQYRNEADKHWLRTIGTQLMKCVGDVDIRQQVSVPKSWQHVFGEKTSMSDALYKWGCNEANRCREADDRCADYFRRRVPIIAIRYAVVDAILRNVKNFALTGKLRFSFKNILLAYHLATYLQEAQMYFFGQKVMTAMETVGKGLSPETKKVSVGARLYGDLPETFTLSDIPLTASAAKSHVYRWRKEGYIKNIKRGTYKKVVKEIF